MFDSLSEKLQGAFRKLGGKGKLSEKDIDEALRKAPHSCHTLFKLAESSWWLSGERDEFGLCPWHSTARQGN